MRLPGSLLPLLLLLPLAACLNLGEGTPTVRYYLLGSLLDRPATPVELVRGLNGKVVVFDPLELAGYLDRPQIAIRVSGNRLHFTDFDRWAEPLPEQIPRVVQENLLRLTDLDTLPERFETTGSVAEASIRLAIDRLEGVEGRDALLAARYLIRDEASGGVLLERQLQLRKEWNGGGPQQLVDGLSTLLGELSERLAADLATQLGGTILPQSQN